MTRRSRIERAEERADPAVAEAIQAARRIGNERRELNALVHMVVGGDMRLDLSPHGMGRRGAGVAGNGAAYCWVSTLHRLERKRQVERLKGGRFTLTASGQARGWAENHRRSARRSEP